MSKMSRTDLGLLASSVGVPAKQVPTAVAIALAESGGDPSATHRNSNGSLDVGLWQINSVHGYSESSMKNPLANAKAMYKISNGGTNWAPWTTYTSGAYKKFTQSTAESINPLDPGNYNQNTVDNVNIVGNAVSGVFNKIFNADLWKRIGVGYLGTMLIMWGIGIILLNTRAGKDAIGAATGAATKGLV